ncbi:copper chaperone PCu(A)C [Streptomyces sp. NPDC058254]|uniref:copper chaperone PCu(A)C n=1 Tax=Streptomyces sp. NPDC058254 TaxID=3346406 RepID=UPI0036F03752
MTEPAVWRPSRRRLAEAFVAALAPVAACVVALGGLAVWTASGAAGSPAHIEVTSGRVFLPYGDGKESAAFFRISNSGGSEDELTGVTSAAIDSAMLGRNTRTSGNAGYMRPVGSATVPAGGTLMMSPQGLDVMVTVRGTWRTGDLVPFELHFRHSGPIKTLALVVRPGTG